MRCHWLKEVYMVNISSCHCMFVHWCYRRNLDGLGFSLRVGFGRTGPVWEIEAILPKTGMIPPRPSLLYWAGFRLGFAWQSRLSSCDTPFLRNCHINHYILLSYYRISVSFNWKYFFTAFYLGNFTDLLWRIKIVWLLTKQSYAVE